MPDPKRFTISASEASALLGLNPYMTRWMLYQKMKHGREIPEPESEFMSEGRRMQPLILERASWEMNLAVEANTGDDYVRRGYLGCTKDAIIIDPEHGPGALEVKCCFSYSEWKEKWGGGETVPPHVEIQLQTQMYVGDSGTYAVRHDDGSARPLSVGDIIPGHAIDLEVGRAARPFTWGMVCVWHLARQYYFRREPNLKLWGLLETEAERFMRDVAEGNEPDPMGSTIELPLIYELFPLIEGKVLDLRDVGGAELYTAKARQYEHAAQTAAIHESNRQSLRAEFIVLAKDADRILLPDGAVVSFGKQRRISVYIPQEVSA